MLGRDDLAGLPAALFTLGSALTAFTIGRVTQRAGRRGGLAAGFAAGSLAGGLLSLLLIPVLVWQRRPSQDETAGAVSRR
jgi:MFS family permease